MKKTVSIQTTALSILVDKQTYHSFTNYIRVLNKREQGLYVASRFIQNEMFKTNYGVQLLAQNS